MTELSEDKPAAGIIAAREQRRVGLNTRNEHWASYPQSRADWLADRSTSAT